MKITRLVVALAAAVFISVWGGPAFAVLIAHYTFEDGTYSGTTSGSTVYNQGNGDSGENEDSVFGGGTSSIVLGGSDAAVGSNYLDLSGSNSSFRISDGIGAGKNFTVAGWYRGSDTDGYYMDHDDSPRVIIANGSGGTGMVNVYDGNWNASSIDASTFANGTWRHLAVTVEDVADVGSTKSVAKVYLGGDLKSTLNLDTEPQLKDDIGNDLRFGAKGTAANTNNLVGHFDDLRFYNEVLDEDRIFNLFSPSDTVGVNIDNGDQSFRENRPTRFTLPEDYVSYETNGTPVQVAAGFAPDGTMGVEVDAPYFRNSLRSDYGYVDVLDESGDPVQGFNTVVNSGALVNDLNDTVEIALTDLGKGIYEIEFMLHSVWRHDSGDSAGVWDISGSATANDVSASLGYNNPSGDNPVNGFGDIATITLPFTVTDGTASFTFTPDTLGDNNQLWVNGLALRFVAVPEPTTLLIWSALAGLGIGLGWRRRK